MSEEMTFERFMAGGNVDGPSTFVRSLPLNTPTLIPEGMNKDSVSKISRELGLRTLVRFLDGEWWACRVDGHR